MEHQKIGFRSPKIAGVTKGTSLLRSIRDFLKLSFHLLPDDDISEVFKFRSDLISEIITPKYT